MADDMVPAWMVEIARLEERIKGQEKLLDERDRTRERNLDLALAALDKRLAAHNDILGAWQRDRASSPTRAELIGIVAAVGAIITIVMNIITK